MESVDLTLIVQNAERASREAAAAFDAVERLVTGVGPRLDALEGVSQGWNGVPARSSTALMRSVAQITA